jgi:hypothetical protein
MQPHCLGQEAHPGQRAENRGNKRQQVSDRSRMAASDFSPSQRAEEIERTEVASRSALTVSQGFGPQMQINLASPNSQIGKRLS